MSARSGRAGTHRPPPAAIAAAVTGAGALATLALGAIWGMPGQDLASLALSLVPALVLSVAAAALAARMLSGASIRRRTLGVVFLASAVGLANLMILAWRMYLGGSDATHLAILLLYSAAAGAGAAFALTRSTTDAVSRLAETARRLGDGDLEARVGPIAAEPELTDLARSLDDMAVRLGASIERERALEAHRLEMITAASHDLRTPLASLRAMIEAIEDGVVPPGPERDRYMAEMGNSLTSLTALTDDLFDLIKLDAGGIAADAEQARLVDVASAALALLRGPSAREGDPPARRPRRRRARPDLAAGGAGHPEPRPERDPPHASRRGGHGPRPPARRVALDRRRRRGRGDPAGRLGEGLRALLARRRLPLQRRLGPRPDPRQADRRGSRRRDLSRGDADGRRPLRRLAAAWLRRNYPHPDRV